MGNGFTRSFPESTRQEGILMVAIDYFTRWAEVKALSSITSKQVQEFF